MRARDIITGHTYRANLGGGEATVTVVMRCIRSGWLVTIVGSRNWTTHIRNPKAFVHEIVTSDSNSIRAGGDTDSPPGPIAPVISTPVCGSGEPAPPSPQPGEQAAATPLPGRAVMSFRLGPTPAILPSSGSSAAGTTTRSGEGGMGIDTPGAAPNSLPKKEA